MNLMQLKQNYLPLNILTVSMKKSIKVIKEDLWLNNIHEALVVNCAKWLHMIHVVYVT